MKILSDSSKKTSNQILNEFDMSGGMIGKWFNKFYFLMRQQYKWNAVMLSRMIEIVKSTIAIFLARGKITPMDIRVFNRIMTKYFDRGAEYTTDNME